MRSSRAHVIGVLAVIGLAVASCQSTDEAASGSTSAGTITIGTTPLGEDPTMGNPIEEFGRLLEEQTGREVDVVDVPDYLAVVEAIRNDHVDMGIFSGFPGALAVNTGEVDPLMLWLGEDHPASTCVVLAGSDVQELTDLRGKTIAFADVGSSTGYFMPVYMLHEAGLEQGVDYEAMFSGGHDRSFAALEQGQVDAACTSIELTELGEPIFPFKDGQWRGVGQSPPLHVAGCVLVRPSLDDQTREQLQHGIAAVINDENAEVLGSLGAFAGLTVVNDPDNSEFAEFVEIAEIAGVELNDLD